jgi:hypothetical protein
MPVSKTVPTNTTLCDSAVAVRGLKNGYGMPTSFTEAAHEKYKDYRQLFLSRYGNQATPD